HESHGHLLSNESRHDSPGNGDCGEFWRGIMSFVWISHKPDIATELYSDKYLYNGREGDSAMSATTPWFIRARLKTRQLMLLTAICDEGNIHRAAEVLNMSQPAASKLLKDLED